MTIKRTDNIGDGSTHQLRKELQRVGFKKEAINAAWPTWWEEQMSSSPSARIELRFILSRNLGLSARSLIGERAEFVWRGAPKFKHFAANNDQEKSVIASFASAASHAILSSLPEESKIVIPRLTAMELRRVILKNSRYVNLRALVVFCWSIGIPVVQLRITPLPQKRMHAMVVALEGRYVVLLAKESNFPTITAFTLAHELGHIFLKHLDENSMIVDAKGSMEVTSDDEEEINADQFAEILLLGESNGKITFDEGHYNAPGLASAAINATKDARIDPAAVVLAFAHQQSDWARGMSALKFIEPENKEMPVWRAVNNIAANQLDLSISNPDTAEFIHKFLELSND